MQNKVEFILNDSSLFKNNIISWSSSFDKIAYFDSNNYKDKTPNSYDILVGVGAKQSIELIDEKDAFYKLQKFYNKHKNWMFGFFSYDLKNDTEKLKSENKYTLDFPVLHFFIPEFVLEIKNNVLIISSNNSTKKIKSIFEEIKLSNYSDNCTCNINFKSQYKKEEYIHKVDNLKKHIKHGDIYEINFCQEFFANNVETDPLSLYTKLNTISPMPFSAFYKLNNKYLISASPERFIKKVGNTVVSQPIKGTIKRGVSKKEDLELKIELQTNIKERAENIMIVDLVRNDLSKIATKNSVKVTELCKIYTYPQVHQMISTIEAQVSAQTSSIEIIKHLFPMGSMTGAPKIKAMELIEEYEESKRGLYSGTVGYIKPDGDFDFNVIIRSLFYNKDKKHLSFQVGGAITIKSDAEKEYEECLIKAKAILKATNIIKHQ